MAERGTLVLRLAACVQFASIVYLASVNTSLSDWEGLSTAQQGWLMTLKQVSMGLAAPVFARFTARASRRLILCMGLLFSAAAMFGSVFFRADEYAALVVWTMLSGAGLGAVTPVVRSLTAVYSGVRDRSDSFGKIEAFRGVGGGIGALVGTLSLALSGGPLDGLSPEERANATLSFDSEAHAAMIADNRPGLVGWELATILVMLIQFGTAYLVWIFAHDPVHDELQLTEAELRATFPGLSGDFARVGEQPMPPSVAEDLRALWDVGTYRLIVLQGVFGSFPWSGMLFSFVWFRRMGIGAGDAVFIYAAVGAGIVVAGLVSGFATQALVELRNDNELSRVDVSIASVLSGVVLGPVFMLAIPHAPNQGWSYAVTGFFLGFCISWTPANIDTITTKVFAPRLHALAFSVRTGIETVVSAFSPGVAGLLADHVFGVGFVNPPGGQAEWESFGAEKREQGVTGLAGAITTEMIVGWLACAGVFLAVRKTYPRDWDSGRQAEGEELEGA